MTRLAQRRKNQTPDTVVHVMQSFAIGGLEKMVLRIAQGANARGHRVCVVATHEDGPIREALEAAGVETRFLACGPGLSPALFAQVMGVLVRLKAGVLHTHHLGPFIYAAPAARVLGIKHVHTEHSHEFYDNARRRAVGRLTTRWAHTVAVSQEIARWRRVNLNARDRVIPNGVHVPAFGPSRDVDRRRAAARTAWGLSREDVVIAAVGRLAPEKGLDVVVDAFSQVAATCPRARLVIVGDGRERDALERRVDALGVKARVRFTGAVPDVDALWPAFDLVTLGSRREGLPLAVLEAAAHGIPFVSTAVGELPRLAEQGMGLCAEVDDVDALARALLSFVTSASARRAFGTRARTVVAARYSAQTMIDAYLDAYRDPHARRPAPTLALEHAR